jgi:hypothetical protein
MRLTESDLRHWGVLGMHWGVNKGDSGSSGGGHRSFHPYSSQDGRKVNKLFGKRSRTAVRNFFLGDAKATIRNCGVLNKKYSSLSKEDKVKMEKKTSNVLAAVSIMSYAALATMLIKK